MRVSKIAAAIALAGMALPTIAQAAEVADQIGRVASTSGDVLIARDGKLVPAVNGQALYKGDRVVTRAGAKAQVAMNGCSNYSMASTSVLSVSSACDAPKTLGASKAGFDNGDALHGSAWLVALLALTAAITGAIVVSDNKHHTPASP